MSTTSSFLDEIRQVEEILGSENVERRGDEAVDATLRCVSPEPVLQRCELTSPCAALHLIAKCAFGPFVRPGTPTCSLLSS